MINKTCFLPLTSPNPLQETKAMNLYASHHKPHLHSPSHGYPLHTTPPFSSPRPPPNSLLSLNPTTPPKSTTSLSSKPLKTPTNPSHLHLESSKEGHGHELLPRRAILGGASLSLVFLLFGLDGHHEALALGPEGPLVEEFWDNMRRYGLYALTVSTGVIYTVFQPIVELLKNPITAILLLVIVVGAGFIVSQVLNAMVGISEFNYDYGY